MELNAFLMSTDEMLSYPTRRKRLLIANKQRGMSAIAPAERWKQCRCMFFNLVVNEVSAHGVECVIYVYRYDAVSSAFKSSQMDDRFHS